MKELSIYLNFNYSAEYKNKISSSIDVNFCDQVQDNCLVLDSEINIDWLYVRGVISDYSINFQFIDFYLKEVELDRYIDSGLKYIHKKDQEFKDLPIVKFEKEFSSLKPVLFLDRDGIINEDSGYTYVFSKEIIYKDIIEVIKSANSLDILVVIVTNQAGVARGKYSISEVELFHSELSDYLKSEGARIDHVEICPFHFEKGNPPWNFDSLLRKPNPGMLLRGAAKVGGSLNHSLMVGDKLSDRISLIGSKSILLKSNYPIDSTIDVFESRSQFCSEVLKYLNKMLDLS